MITIYQFLFVLSSVVAQFEYSQTATGVFGIQTTSKLPNVHSIVDVTNAGTDLAKKATDIVNIAILRSIAKQGVLARKEIDAKTVKPTLANVNATVENGGHTVRDVELFAIEASSQLFDIFKEFAFIMTERNQQHIDFSYSLIEKLNAAATRLKALSFTAKEMLTTGDEILNTDLKFALQKIRRSGDVIILGEDVARLGINLKALQNMATDKDIAPYEKDDASSNKSYEPDIIDIINLSNDPEEVKYYWKEWHDKKTQYKKYFLFDIVEIYKEAAKKLELPVLELWYENYSKELLDEIHAIMKQLKPFFDQLHAYVRHQLIKKYGVGVIKPDGPIPEHLYDQVIMRNEKSDFMLEGLFENELLTDLDAIALNISDHYEAKNLLKETENYYTSIGFEPLSEELWKTKIVEQAENEESNVCTPTINDITYDVSLQYCDKVNFKTLMQDYAFIGRLHLALEKKNLPTYFFSGYNLKYPIVEAIKLSGANHLLDTKAQFANEEYEVAYNERRNFRMAIDTMLKIPRLYVHTLIITGLLEGTIEESKLNKHYWSLMDRHAGVEPPIDRTLESLDLPFSFYANLNRNNDVISEFSAQILSYQFYRVLCQKAGFRGSLHLCDFYGSKKVGKALKAMTSLGSSKPWHEVIGVLFAENSTFEPSALLEYYAPIRKRIKQYIETNKLETGWTFAKKRLSGTVYPTEDALAFIERADDKIYELYERLAAEAFDKNADTDDIEDFLKNSDQAVAKNTIVKLSVEARIYYRSQLKYVDLKKALRKLAKFADGLDNRMSDVKYYLHRIGKRSNVIRYEPKDDEDKIAYNPNIQEIFQNSNDYNELLYYWEAWRDMNTIFKKRIVFDTLEDLSDAANKLGISKTQFWLKNYPADFMDQMEKVINDLRPFYMKLYAYVRSAYLLKYNDVNRFDLIPEHVYQQIMQQIWTNYSAVEEDLSFNKLPPSYQFVHDQNNSAVNLLLEANKFYQSLGFEALDENFWKNRVKPVTNENAGNCHATIYDWSPTAYVRYCEQIDFREFLQAHGHMGRIHYAQGKRNIPSYYFNSYFLEHPVGEAVMLSASSPKHLKEIGLSGDFELNDEMELNRLIRMAIHTYFNLHIQFVHTKVIADYLNGDVTKEDLNRHYWKLMIKYAGVDPPLDRKDVDFDFPYEFYIDLVKNPQATIIKFVSEVLGYQFYESLCKNQKGDLHNCDFYGDKKAGASLQEMFQLGGSKSWQSTVKVLLPDGPKLSAGAILRYYSPIEKWLDRQIKVKNIYVGFGNTKRKFIRSEDFIPKEGE